MLKKIISVILVFVLALSFAGCQQKPSDSGSNDANTSANADSESANDQKIETDEKLLTVEITLPATLFDDQDFATFDADAYAKEQGFLSAIVNSDNTVTVTMTKGRHKELIKEMTNSLDAAFAEFVEGESTPYIKEITHNEDFTAVTMKVDQAAYENAFDFTPLAIALSAAAYQAFTEIEYHVDITIVDATTGNTIKTISYPDAMNG